MFLLPPPPQENELLSRAPSLKDKTVNEARNQVSKYSQVGLALDELRRLTTDGGLHV